MGWGSGTYLFDDLMEILFSKEGEPDGIWFYEDLGFKQKPFMSPAMYKEIIQPGHIKTIQYGTANKAHCKFSRFSIRKDDDNFAVRH